MGFNLQPNSDSGIKGMMLVNPKYRGSYSLWKITQTGCELRIYPQLGANNEVLPTRYGIEPSDVGNWVVCDHYGIEFAGGDDAGKEKITTLVAIKGDEKLPDPNQRRGLRIWDHIRNTLYHAIKSGTAPSHWARWTLDEMQAAFGPASKSKARPIAFARGMLTLYNTGKGAVRSISRNQAKMNCLFFFKPAAQNALIDLIMEKVAGAENLNTDDWDKVFAYNKVIDMNEGRLLTFGKPGMFDPVQAPDASAGPVSFGVGAAQQQQKDEDQYKVEARVSSEPFGIPIEYLQESWKVGWEDLLNVYEDEAELIAALEVGIADDLLIAAFKDTPHWLSERLRYKAQQTQAASVVGTTGSPMAQAPAVNAGMVFSQAPVVPAGAPAAAIPSASPQVAVPGSEPTYAAPPVATPAPPVDESPALPPANPPSEADSSPEAPAVAIPGNQPDGSQPTGLADMEAALAAANQQATGG